MKKNFRLIIVMIAVLCLMASLVACNPSETEDPAQRLRVTGDFVALGLERVNPLYKAEMTDEEILALEQPQEYILTKNMMSLFATVLNSTSIRIQKLEKLNELVLSDQSKNLFGEDEERTSADDVEDSFMILSEAGWTSDDFADLFYSVIATVLGQSKEVTTTMIAELNALKLKVVRENYLTEELYLDTIEDFDDAIESAQAALEIIDEVVAPESNVVQTVANSEQAIKKVFGSLAKTVLMLNTTPFLDLSEMIETTEPLHPGTPPTLTFNGTAAELSAYVGGIKENLDSINDSFPKQEIIEISNAIITVEKLLWSLGEYLPIMQGPSFMMSVSSVLVHMLGYGGEFVSNGLGVIDVDFAQDFMDVSSGEYSFLSSSILIAQIVEGAVGTHDAVSLKALFDDYKVSVGTDIYNIQKHLIGLIFLGQDSIFSEEENSYEYVTEADLDKIVSTVRLNEAYSSFMGNRTGLSYAIAHGDDPEDVEDYKSDLTENAETIMIRINKITGQTPDMSGYTPYTEEWFNKIEAECEATLNLAAETLFDKVLNAYKATIDDFFTTDMPKIIELAAMEMQTEEGAGIARLAELEEEMRFSSMYISILYILTGTSHR